MRNELGRTWLGCLAFGLRYRGKPWIAGVWADIRTRDLPTDMHDGTLLLNSGPTVP